MDTIFIKDWLRNYRYMYKTCTWDNFISQINLDIVNNGSTNYEKIITYILNEIFRGIGYITYLKHELPKKLSRKLSSCTLYSNMELGIVFYDRVWRGLLLQYSNGEIKYIVKSFCENKKYDIPCLCGKRYIMHENIKFNINSNFIKYMLNYRTLKFKCIKYIKNNIRLFNVKIENYLQWN